MSTSAQRNAIRTLIDIAKGRVSKPKPAEIELLAERAEAGCAILEWCEENKPLIVKAKQMQEAGE